MVSDSTYVVNCFKDRWWQGWQRRNWRNSQNKPVANRDLWEPLIELALAPEPAPRVTFRWVKGHSGDRWNDRVDELATLAADRGRGRAIRGTDQHPHHETDPSSIMKPAWVRLRRRVRTVGWLPATHAA